MAFEGLPAYIFTAQGIREGALEQSGVYAIFTPRQWVFIGDADNVRQALFDLLNIPHECIHSQQPLSFSWEGVSRSDCESRREALIANLQPRCNGKAPAR